MPGPSEFMVGNAPGGASFGGRLLDFSTIGNLGADYYQGRAMQRQDAMATAFPNGVPMKDGQPDIDAIVNRGAQLGGLPYLQGLLPYLYGEKLGMGGANAITGSEPDARGEASPGSDQNSPHGASPANLRGGTPEGGEATSIRSIVGRAGGDPDNPSWDAIAKRMGLPDAGAPLSPAQAANFQKWVQATGAGRRPQSGTDKSTEVPDTPADGAEPVAGGPPTAGPAPSGVSGAPGPVATPPAPGRVAQAFGDLAGAPGARSVKTTTERPPPTALPPIKVTPKPEGVVMPQVPGVPPGVDPAAYAESLNKRATAIEAKAAMAGAMPGGVGVEQAKILQAQAADLRARRDKINDFMAKVQEPTTEQKNLQSGATERGDVLKKSIDRGQKVYNGVTAASDQYEQEAKGILNVSRSILNTPGVFTGIGAERKFEFDKVRAMFGDEKAAMLTGALQKATAQSVLSTIGRFRDAALESGSPAGKLFQSELDQIEKSSVNITNPTAANRFLVEWQTRLGEQSKALAQMAREYLGAGHSHLDVGFDTKMSEYLEKHPLFAPQELAHPELVGAPTAPSKNAREAAQWVKQMDLGEKDAVRVSGPGEPPKYVHAGDIIRAAAGKR